MVGQTTKEHLTLT